MQEIMDLIRSTLKGIWTYRWWGFFSMVLFGVGGIALVDTIPNQYEATTRVYVDTQSILRPLMSGLAVQPNADQQIAMVSRTLVSRPNIERVVRMSDLDLKATTQANKDALIDSLMKSIRFTSAGGTNLYAIAYRSDRPEQARKVVQAFLSIFVESNLGDSRRDSDQAKKFIEDQIKIYEQRLTDSENALKNFKIRNLSAMPALNTDTVGRVGETGSALAQARLDLSQAENARDELRKQLSIETPTIAADDRGTVFGPGTQSAAAPTRPFRTEFDDRIEAQRKRVDDLKLRYTDAHPDVIATRRVLEQLEASRDTERKAEQAKAEAALKAAAATPNIPSRVAGTIANPVYQQLRVSLAESEATVASLKAKVREYEARTVALQASAANVPKIEAEFKQLNRDYEITKRNYEQLVSRRESASLSEQMGAASGIGEFRVIDPPRASNEPVYPNRAMMLTGVLLASIAAGLAVAFIRDQIRPTFYDLRALRLATGLPILGTISMIVDAKTKARARRGVLAISSGAAAYLSLFGVLLAWAWLKQLVK
ncbi:MAG: chain length-determining protein [Burkholderiaceae bacterium]|nr:chain length-determining protein [Burkholderiaceae bacterium]